MQTLGLADSTPRTGNRFTSLLWPAIQTEVDVDYVSRQGFWMCAVVAAMTILMGATEGPLVWALSLVEALFFYLAGVRIRQRSIAAAVIAFTVYLLSSFLLGARAVGIVRAIFLALLLTNIRGTWLSAKWRPTAVEPPPLPPDVTFLDKFSGTWPIRLWPAMRWVFYPLAALDLIGLPSALFGLTTTS